MRLGRRVLCLEDSASLRMAWEGFPSVDLTKVENIWDCSSRSRATTNGRREDGLGGDGGKWSKKEH